MERGRLVKEQSWVPGMGVAFCECCQLYGARCGLESPCSWGRPDDLCCPHLLESGISLHGSHVLLSLKPRQKTPTS